MFKVWDFADEVSDISAYAARKRQTLNNLDESHRELTSEGAEGSNGSQRDQYSEDSLVASSKHEVRNFHERFGREVAGGSKDDPVNSNDFSDSPGDGDELAADTITYVAYWRIIWQIS